MLLQRAPEEESKQPISSPELIPPNQMAIATNYAWHSLPSDSLRDAGISCGTQLSTVLVFISWQQEG